MSRYLVTGGAGFSGSHIVAEALKNGHKVTSLDCLTYAASLDNLANLHGSNLNVVHHDFSKPVPNIGNFDFIIHCGACSHVTRSLQRPADFVQANVIGTMNMLEFARRGNIRKFVYISTDEVFGPAEDKPFNEGSRLNPTNPYSATKAAGEFLSHSYYRSFKVPVVITRTINLFGEHQHSEKFIPLVIGRILRGETVSVHARPRHLVLRGHPHNLEPGSRNWLYVGEQARAVVALAERGFAGQICHVSSGVRKTNLEIAQLIAKILGKKLDYKLVESDRPNHDLHYSLRESPQSIYWKLNENFEDQMTRTVQWYLSHREFLA